jgi:hypothetical protein
MSDPILSECINPTCPISGEPVAPNSLTTYKGHTVSFGEPEDRDKFAAAPDDFPDAIHHFDQRIAEGTS